MWSSVFLILLGEEPMHLGLCSAVQLIQSETSREKTHPHGLIIISSG